MGEYAGAEGLALLQEVCEPNWIMVENGGQMYMMPRWMQGFDSQLWDGVPGTVSTKMYLLGGAYGVHMIQVPVLASMTVAGLPRIAAFWLNEMLTPVLPFTWL